MKYLWSPWRMKYILSEKAEKCVFCKAVQEEDGVNNLIAYRGRASFVILNRYPYTSGHLMVVPYTHQPGLGSLDPEIRAEMMELVNRSVEVLREAYHPQGFNIGANIGDTAGAGIPDHVHLHVVPRWLGDTNFMSSLANTRVLPESLEDTYARITAAWQGLKNKDN